LDITSNSLILDPRDGAFGKVRDEIIYSYDLTSLTGRWDRPGIKTSLGLTIPSGTFASKSVRLGYGDNAVLGKTSFAGVPVESDDILVKWTFQGDADLDGDADGVDIGTWATNFTGELGGTGTMVWTQGDWDYDRDVDGVDAGAWAQDFTGELGGVSGGGALRPGGGGGGGDHIDDPDIAALLQLHADTDVPLLKDWESLWT
jgi:hypothetical protein